ncbi:MAG: MAPEG family protein [Brevundimonas sp.]|uniref:MAPEG family protein n=1 Tax=Brevundimonas sp. TaxID=1871086 RepID=UPI0025BC9116|nr:MAPEG family protein [Brevundimonas sp.]MBX3477228.1 MAPEG family protein [Brevundimonas sp.]
MTQALHAAGLWTGLLIVLLVVLSALVVTRRRRRLVAFGDGGHADLTAASRAFGNASEYAPVGIAGLILLALLGAPVVTVHAVGATLFLGRIVHALGLLFQKGPSLGRILGMVLTYLALIAAAAGLIALAVG